MKVYSLNPVSVHQEDSKMNTVQPSLPAQGMFLDTPQKLAELDPQDFVKTVNNMNNAQAAYQSQTDAENNKYSHIFKNQKQTPVVENPKNITETTKDVRLIDNGTKIAVQEYHEDGNATTNQSGGKVDNNNSSIDEDFCFDITLPKTNQKLYIYNKCMHHEQIDCKKGGLILPEEQQNEENWEGGACKKSANGIAFSEKDLNGCGIDSLIQSLDSARGGVIPAIVGELALNLIPAIPSIISAIKNKRDNAKVGQGLINSMRQYDTVRAIMQNLPENKPSQYYNDMITTFNAFKRIGKGISFDEGSGVYYGGSKVVDGLRNFWSKIKSWYGDNKEVFAPIKDALLNAASNTINNTVNNASNKLTDYVNKKTNNEDIKNITKSVVDVTKNISQQGIDMLKGNGIESEKVYSVLN